MANIPNWMVNGGHSSVGNPSDMSDINDPRADFYPFANSEELLQNEIWKSQDDNPLVKFWRDLTGKNEQVLGMANQQFLLNREQEFEREMLKIQNEYNSPANQVKMMQDAGLNISSLFGSSQNFVSSGSPSSPSAPGVPAAGSAASQGFSSMANALYQTVQGKLANAQVDNLNAQTQEVKQNLVLRPLSTWEQIKRWRSESEKYASSAGLDKENADWIKAQRIYFVDTKDLNKTLLQQNINNAIQTGYNLVQEEEKLKAQTREASTAADVNQATVGYVKAETGLVREQTRTQEAITDQEKDKAQISEWHRQAVQTIVNELGELPLPTEEKEWLASKLVSDDPAEREVGEKLLRGLGDVAVQVETNETNAQFENFGKRWLMDLGNAALNLVPDFHIVASPHGKTKTNKIGF